jgi:hypothetical protein
VVPALQSLIKNTRCITLPDEAAANPAPRQKTDSSFYICGLLPSNMHLSIAIKAPFGQCGQRVELWSEHMHTPVGYLSSSLGVVLFNLFGHQFLQTEADFLQRFEAPIAACR